MAAPITRELLHLTADEYQPAVLARCDEIATSLYPEDSWPAHKLLFSMYDVVCNHAETPTTLLDTLPADQIEIEDLMLGLAIRCAAGFAAHGLTREERLSSLERVRPLPSQGAV